MHDLIKGWRKCKLDSPPYLFPGDEEFIDDSNSSVYRSFNEYIASKSFGLSADPKLQTGLLPQPYLGNLANASIYLLMLNPGVSDSGYFTENNQPKFKQALIRNLRQRNEDDDYPFFILDPRLAWSPGFQYWNRKFHSLVSAIAEQKELNYRLALSYLSRRLACLELVPYHSKTFGAGKLISELPSVKSIQQYVRDVIVPKAQSGKAIIIATRGVKHWQLPKPKGGNTIITYKSGEIRSAFLTLNSRGGKAIAKHLGLTI